MKSREIAVRPARRADLEAVLQIDAKARNETERRDTIAEFFDAGHGMVAEVDGELAGYALVDRRFFGQCFVHLLYVAEDARRRGVGSALMLAAEAACPKAKLFTSTNRSNRPMQALLVGLDYAPCGLIDELDPGDPEVVYCKRLDD